eukprot:SAG22_NODE_1733_length_3697_cov_2.532518_2_plen_55_part_00
MLQSSTDAAVPALADAAVPVLAARAGLAAELVLAPVAVPQGTETHIERAQCKCN